jgi:transposase
MMHYAGLDVSLKETSICVVDEKGFILKEGKTASEPDAITQWLASVEVDLHKVGLEIGGLARWLYAELRARGVRAVCIDPRKLRGVTKTMPIKTDRNDARAIAHAMRVGWFSPVHVKSEASQELRMLLTNRKMLQTKQIDIDNEIRGTLRSFGLKLSGRITPATFEHRTLELLQDFPRLLTLIRPMLVARRALREQCAVLHRMLLQLVRTNETCKRLMTVPGVGLLVAVTYMVTIDDPDRFQRSRDVGAHLGLTPTKYASGEVDRNGNISKCGDAMLRANLYQAALALLTRTSKWSTLRAWGMAVAKRRGLRRAVVAVSRKLAIVLHRIWADGTVFQWSREPAAV